MDGATFQFLGLNQRLVDGLGALNIIKPTSIQLRTIPLLLSGKNVMCTAETGSGKTLAYLLPMLDALHRYNAANGPCQLPNKPFGIVLAPSRELAKQIHLTFGYDTQQELCSNIRLCFAMRQTVLTDLAPFFPLRADVKCGGNRTQRLLREIPLSLVDVVVGTPGVFSKLLSNRMYDLSRLSFVVADEADSLLDDSFSPLTLRIIRKLKVTSELPVSAPPSQSGSDLAPPHMGTTQIAFVGATLPRSVGEILGEIVPVDTIETVTTNHVHRIMPHVAQKFLRLGPSEKPARLLAHLKSSSGRRVPTLVFCNSSSTACFLGYLLESNGISHVLLHSRMPHSVREGRYEQFQNGQTDVLLCTDIASRGLDTTRARHVVNYEFPHHMSDYVHRVGRVGRVGSDGAGFVLSFVTYKWDVDLLWQIEAAQRKRAELHNVNANIKRKLAHRLDVPGVSGQAAAA